MNFQDFNDIWADAPVLPFEDRSNQVFVDGPEEPYFTVRTSNDSFNLQGKPNNFSYCGLHFNSVAKFMKEFDLANVDEYDVIVNDQIVEFGFR